MPCSDKNREGRWEQEIYLKWPNFEQTMHAMRSGKSQSTIGHFSDHFLCVNKLNLIRQNVQAVLKLQKLNMLSNLADYL